jgi:hypothetical protein
MELAVLALTAFETRQLIAGIVAIATGVLILIFPDYIVAAYLIIVGILFVLVATD